MKSVEQVVRDLLEQATKDRLVTFNRKRFGSTSRPQDLTAGDLCGTANVLTAWLLELKGCKSATPPTS